MLWIFLGLLAAGGILAFAVGDSGSLGGLDGGQIASLVGLLAMLIFLAGPLFKGRRGEISKNLRDLVYWVFILLAIVLAYSFRNDFKEIYQRVAGELLPPGHTLSISDSNEPALSAVRIRRQPDGHFEVRASVNGQVMPMLVDTGASSVVLKASDATRAGLDLKDLKFIIPINTANGTAYAAAARLQSITIGTITMRNLRVMVTKPGTLRSSLLGMNFLTRLRSYEFSGEFLTLRG